MHLSPNRYNDELWKVPTAKTWVELSRSFDRYFVIARNNKISLRVSTRNKITVILLPSANKRCLEFLVTSFVIVLLAPVLGVSVIVSQCPINGGIAALACKWFYKIRVIHELHGMFILVS